MQKLTQHTIQGCSNKGLEGRRERQIHTSIEIEAPEIVEEFAVDLATKDIEATAAHGDGMSITAGRCSAFGGYACPLSRAKIEEIETIVLLVRITGLGVAAPDDEDTRDQGRRVTDSWRRDLSGGLDERGGEISGVEGVEVIFDRFADEASEKEEFTGLGCGEGERVAVSGEGGR